MTLSAFPKAQKVDLGQACCFHRCYATNSVFLKGIIGVVVTVGSLLRKAPGPKLVNLPHLKSSHLVVLPTVPIAPRSSIAQFCPES